MKLALSSTGKELKDTLDLRFGRCTYFLIYDTEKGLLKTVENKGQLSGGGAGIAAAQQMIDEDVEAVITGNMGPNAYNLMKNSGIRVYQSNAVPCEEAVKLMLEGKLTELTEAGPAHMGMGMGRGFRGGN